LIRSLRYGGSIATELHLEFTVARSRRPLFVLILSLLLVGMQAGAQLHALEHDGERLARPHDAALLVPGADEVCAVCALFAGGANAIAGDNGEIEVRLPARERALPMPESLTPAFASYYQSRAPPSPR